jgi:polysaccharide biosynthesis/export protein
MEFRSAFQCIIAATLVSLLSAAETDSKLSSSATEGRKSVDYLLQPGDLLKVDVFQEDDLRQEVRISQEYTIKLSLIGTLDLRGKTLRQTEELVRSLYDKDYLVNPQVTINVKEYVKRTVDVQGSVGKPGSVEFPPEEGLTLLQAISRAGGFNRLADKKGVLLTRKAPDGHSETTKINAADIIDGTSKENWPLQKDDTIFVPERIL